MTTSKGSTQLGQPFSTIVISTEEPPPAERNTLSRLQSPTITQYLIGGLFGNAPILLALFVVTFLDPSWVDLQSFNIILSALMLGGATMAAYFISIMVQRAEKFRVVIVGVVTGSFCFIVNLALTIVFGIYFGLPFPPYFVASKYIDYFRAALFIPGGIAGALIRTRFQRTPRSR
jgi:hypothetical protein